MNRGALYLVWGDKAESRLANSRESLSRFHPGLPQHVERMPGATLLDKAKLFDLSPFDETLFLDVDTTVLAPLDFGFEKAAKFGLACCICEVPQARRWGGIEGDTVEYNTGVLFFTRQSKAVFDLWKSLAPFTDPTFHHADHGVIRTVNDQPSFAVAVERSGFNPYVLPMNWNFRPFYQKSIRGNPVIWHDWRIPSKGILDFAEQQRTSKTIQNATIV